MTKIRGMSEAGLQFKRRINSIFKKQTCENCGCELTKAEIEYGAGWCEECLVK